MCELKGAMLPSEACPQENILVVRIILAPLLRGLFFNPSEECVALIQILFGLWHKLNSLGCIPSFGRDRALGFGRLAPTCAPSLAPCPSFSPDPARLSRSEPARAGAQ